MKVFSTIILMAAAPMTVMTNQLRDRSQLNSVHRLNNHHHLSHRVKAPIVDPCVHPVYKGDNYCDDENNTPGCEFDGGDCCGTNVKTNYCADCQCLDPNYIEVPTPKTCVHPVYKGDDYCDDGNNTPECEFDGGDCCGNNVKTNYCADCQCLDPDYIQDSSDEQCEFPDNIYDGVCDDGNNKPNCGYDAEDCCRPYTDTSRCNECLCLIPGYNPPTCDGIPDYIGNGRCNDENNNFACGFDGGDCCGPNVNPSDCYDCACVDPYYNGPPGPCVYKTVGNEICDHENNKPECEYDGGDCCHLPSADIHDCIDPDFLPNPCGSPENFGDGVCDNANNNYACQYDGGDCCGPEVDGNPSANPCNNLMNFGCPDTLHCQVIQKLGYCAFGKCAFYCADDTDCDPLKLHSSAVDEFVCDENTCVPKIH